MVTVFTSTIYWSKYVNKESNQTNLYTLQTCNLQLICTGISNSNKTSND